jgi:lipoprotein-anchoring transpeptidase ErfK/SrfK
MPGAAPAAPEVFAATAPPSSPTSVVAYAAVPTVGIYESPGASEPQRTLDDPQPSGSPLVFLVRERQPDWIEVLLPVRPNGSTGWVRQADVTLYEHDYAVVVELQTHRVTVFKAGETLLQEPAGIGTSNTPTPGGLYYLKELLKPPDPNGTYGPFAFGLSGFSNVLTSFQGGEGVIGLHGTNDPSGLGKDVSAGCIRIDNDAITRLAEILPLGTPVEIRP